jgi:hypothetical protein
MHEEILVRIDLTFAPATAGAAVGS